METHLCCCVTTHLGRAVRLSYIYWARFLSSVVPHAHDGHTQVHLQSIHNSHQYEA